MSGIIERSGMTTTAPEKPLDGSTYVTQSSVLDTFRSWTAIESVGEDGKKFITELELLLAKHGFKIEKTTTHFDSVIVKAPNGKMCMVLAFTETMNGANGEPLINLTSSTKEALVAKGYTVTDTILVTPNDYKNALRYDKIIRHLLGVHSNAPEYTIQVASLVDGQVIEFNPSISTAQKTLSTNFVHGGDPLPAMDMAITFTMRPQKGGSGSSVLLGVVTAVFAPEVYGASRYSDMETYIPLVRLTSIVTTFPDVTMSALLEALAINYWCDNNARWLRPFFDFSKGAQNLGNLVVLENGELYRAETEKSLAALLYDPNRACFSTPKPVPLIDVVAGRLYSNLTPFVTSNADRKDWAHRRVASFFNVPMKSADGKSTVDTLTPETLPPMFVAEVAKEYVGYITGQGQDTRAITYLQQLANNVRPNNPALMGLKRIGRSAEEKYVNLSQLQRDYLSEPYYVAFTWSVNPKFVEVIMTQLGRTSVTFDDLGSDSKRHDYNSPVPSSFELAPSGLRSIDDRPDTKFRDIKL